MKVAFLHMDFPGHEQFRTYAEIMVQSVRRSIPNVEIVHMCDRKTREVSGVDTVQRRPLRHTYLMEYRLEHFCEVEGDVLFIDTDTIMLRDPSKAFADCDVALTKRTKPILMDGKNIVGDMPYNTGVMFSRKPEFWRDCLELSRGMDPDLRHWFGDQMAVKRVARSGKFDVKDLMCDEYNYSPKWADEPLEGKYIIHYKGGRKDMMLAHAEQLGYYNTKESA
jgi:hypothetical protein